MITFLVSIVLLIAGYALYGKLMERIFGVKADKQTPAYTMQDGVDYVPMSWPKIFLIQFLNIAGLGPIFGAILGAVYGPAAFLWIVFGSIFGGAVHDYLSGMMSLRSGGLSLPEITGRYLGNNFKQFMRAFTLILMIVVGTVFVSGPAGLLASLTPTVLDTTFWGVVIFLYYILATILPIDKIIGKIYPIFGFTLLFMAVGICFGIFYYGGSIPEATLSNLHNMNPNPDKFPIFPMMFVSIACGAISGFHATQSPLMARCLRNEKEARRVFYGSMITEALVALIWAAAAMSFFGSVGGLQQFLAENNNSAAIVVDKIAHSWLGAFGGLLAIIGVIAAPITTGDTAFRSARLIAADFLRYDQKSLKKRLFLAVPLFLIGGILLQIQFDVIWRYMASMNQVLAAITLWTITIYLVQKKKFYWVTLLPAIFMTAVTSSYLLIAPEGFELPHQLSYTISGIFTLVVTALFAYWKIQYAKNNNVDYQ